MKLKKTKKNKERNKINEIKKNKKNKERNKIIN